MADARDYYDSHEEIIARQRMDEVDAERNRKPRGDKDERNRNNKPDAAQAP